MIISDKLKKEFLELQNSIDLITDKNSVIDTQLETFLKSFEKARYNLLSEIKIYNNGKKFEYEKIKNIDNEYNAELNDNILKIYVPEVLPSYKNIKTHTHKRITLNISKITEKYADTFTGKEVFIYIKVFDKVLGWDIDNRYIKPISDGLILSKVIKDDNLSEMFYCAKGEISDIPHTEIYVLESKIVTQFLEKSISRKCLKFEDF